MQVAMWGNSLAVRIPVSVVELLGLVEGDDIDIHVTDHRAFGIEKRLGKADLLASLRKYRGRLPKDFHFDRLESHGRTEDIH